MNRAPRLEVIDEARTAPAPLASIQSDDDVILAVHVSFIHDEPSLVLPKPIRS